MRKVKLPINAATIARTIVLVLALVNQIFAILGRDQVDIANDDIYQLVTIAFTVCSAIVAWWKNNSFTQNAIAADVVLNDLNSGFAGFIIKNTEEDETGSME